MAFDHFLIEKGVHVFPDWALQWQEAATSAVPGFARKSVSVQQELLYQEVLRSNLHLIGRQALPADLQVCLISLASTYLHQSGSVSLAICKKALGIGSFVSRRGTKGSCRGSFFCKQMRLSMSLLLPSIGINSCPPFPTVNESCVAHTWRKCAVSKSCRYEEAQDKRCLKLVLTDGAPLCLFDGCCSCTQC